MIPKVGEVGFDDARIGVWIHEAPAVLVPVADEYPVVLRDVRLWNMGRQSKVHLRKIERGCDVNVPEVEMSKAVAQRPAQQPHALGPTDGHLHIHLPQS